MKYFLRLSTLLLGIVLGASAVFVFQHIKLRANTPQTAERALSKSVQPIATSITEISLERTECYGPCPTYKLILRKDGTASYIGEANVKRKGKYKGKVFEYYFNRLAALMESHGYTDINFADNNVLCFDSPHVITSVSYDDGRHKTIDKDECLDSMPDMAERATKLWEIEMAIDGVAASIDWQPDK